MFACNGADAAARGRLVLLSLRDSHAADRGRSDRQPALELLGAIAALVIDGGSLAGGEGSIFDCIVEGYDDERNPLRMRPDAV